MRDLVAPPLRHALLQTLSIPTVTCQCGMLEQHHCGHPLACILITRWYFRGRPSWIEHTSLELHRRPMPVSRPAAAAELSKRTRPAVTPLQGAACGAQWQKCNPPGGGAAEVSSRCRLGHSPGLRPSGCARLSSNHRPRPEAPAAGRWGRSYPAGGKAQSCGKKGQSLREKSSNPAGRNLPQSFLPVVCTVGRYVRSRAKTSHP